MEIKCIGVVGAGTMGSGIAQVAAQAAYQVLLRDLEAPLLEKGLRSIENSLDRFVRKGSLSPEEKRSVMERIHTTTDLKEFQQADFVIEAVIEDTEVKRSLFRELDRICPPQTVFATNTSSISITLLASSTRRPRSFIGMHFTNPVPVMKLVEVVRGYATGEETVHRTLALADEMGKIPVEVNDFPGFVSNRVLMPMINEAIFALMEGVATREAIDSVMKLGMNHPMGPLMLADFIGLDVCLAVMEVLFDAFKDSKYRPCPLLRKMVQAGTLGCKSGRGFYDYP
ncbi:MAG: 3-hydroxybutyryl-CoA dehydrogenase [Acidobacteria bacterium]|nr:3-hydroxybutyryl-CoA dehydrogenase [Acidobacteriota bacterium]